MALLKRRTTPVATVQDSNAPATLPLSSLTNIAAYSDPHWMELFNELSTYSHDVHIFSSGHPPQVHRKGWEWNQTIWGLERLGMLRPDAKAIGVGAGRECVIFYLGDKIAHVVATDLYGNEEWSSEGGREADAAVLEVPQAFCPRPIRSEAIEFRTMDGTSGRLSGRNLRLRLVAVLHRALRFTHPVG